MKRYSCHCAQYEFTWTLFSGADADPDSIYLCVLDQAYVKLKGLLLRSISKQAPITQYELKARERLTQERLLHEGETFSIFKGSFFRPGQRHAEQVAVKVVRGYV